MKITSHTQQISVNRTLLVRALAGLLAALAALTALPRSANAGVFIGVGVSVGVPPPPLPVYEQPPIPGPGYIWTPGYWAWDGNEYYWVPGTWVDAPFYGALWTPGYWGWNSGFYVFHPGYWGYHVGFYGGINYGWGYNGIDYVGGYWGHGGFYYNRAVNRFGGVHINNIYNRTVINNINRVSFNGGHGGIAAHATPQQMAFARQARMGPIAAQQHQMTLASHDPALRASYNHGVPSLAATRRPGAFNGAGVATMRGSNRFTPAAASVSRMNNSVVHAPQNMPIHNGTALRSANFAPHAAPSNFAHTNGQYGPVSRPRGMVSAPSNHAMPMNMHPMNGYRAPSTAYRAAPAYHAPAYRAPPAPQYHAFRPAAAPRPVGSAPHGGGGGHAPHHG